MIGLDYTSRIDPAALKAAGATVICRYIAPQAWKIIGHAEYLELLAHGFTVFLNWESSATDWAGGTAAGISDANRAASMADALNYGHGHTIIGSCDFDASPPAVQSYAAAFKNTLNSRGYGAGVYGPYNILSLCGNLGYNFYWQSMSTGFANNSKQHPRTNLWQKGYKTVGGQQCDWSQIINIPGGSMATEDQVLALVTRALNGFTDVGQPTANLVGTWVHDNQVAQGQILAATKANTDALVTVQAAIANLSTGAVDLDALAAKIKAILPTNITGKLS